jgi:hypothetical protein
MPRSAKLLNRVFCPRNVVRALFRAGLAALLAASASVSLFAGAIESVLAHPREIVIEGRLDERSGVVLEGFTAEFPGGPREVLRLAQPGRFRVSIPRFDGERDRIYSGFSLASEEGSRSGTPVVRFVERFDGVSKNNGAYPRARGKKGLQVQMVDDALRLGIQHAALNVNLAGLVDPAGNPDNLSLVMDGRTYWFNRGAVEALDRSIHPLSGAGVVVSLILLNYEGSDPAINKIMLHPRYDRSCPNHLSAFNTVTGEGWNYFRASVEFLAARYSGDGPGGALAGNYILGNEVNSHWFWSNMGHVSMEEFARDYLAALRACHAAIRKYSASARVFISLEHHWNIRYAGGDGTQTFRGRLFLDYLNRRCREQGDFDWNVAFHPYPENLFECRTWNDRSATDSFLSDRVTFKNIHVLCGYLRQPEFLYDGAPRHIILSEQGFHTADRPEGELWQAAAYCYAYYKCSVLPGIDAFILHRHVDHGGEGGLKLGLWTRDETSSSPSRPLRKKLVYEVFRRAGTPEWEQAFAFALPVIGITNWHQLDPPP